MNKMNLQLNSPVFYVAPYTRDMAVFWFKTIFMRRGIPAHSGTTMAIESWKLLSCVR